MFHQIWVLFLSKFYSENKNSGMHMQGCLHIQVLFVSIFHSKKTACLVWLAICFHSSRHFCKQELKFCPSQEVCKYLLSVAEYFELWLMLWHLSSMQNNSLPHKIRLEPEKIKQHISLMVKGVSRVVKDRELNYHRKKE